LNFLTPVGRVRRTHAERRRLRARVHPTCPDRFVDVRGERLRDGWYILVVEGASAFDDEGDYTFTVKLTCKTAGCGC